MRLAVERAKLRHQIKHCRACPLHQVGNGPVPFTGPIPADIAVVGEAPGRQEDEQGQPFIGASGQLIRALLSAHRVDMGDWFVCNTVSCFPDRTPNDKEVRACSDNLIAQLSLARPRWILALGSTALSAFRPDLRITNVRGRPMAGGVKDGRLVGYGELGPDDVAFCLFPTFHPAAALRDPNRKRDLRRDIDRFMELANGGMWELGCYKCKGPVFGFDSWGLGLCAVHHPAISKGEQMAMAVGFDG